MFVTREERLPLGGATGFWLPVTGIAFLLFFLIGHELATPPAGIRDVFGATPVWWRAGLFFLGSLLFLGRAGRWLNAVAASALIGAWFTLLTDFGPGLPGWLFWVSWATAIALAGAVLDSGTGRRIGLPQYRFVFLRLLSLPVVIGVFVCLAALSALFAGAVFQLSGAGGLAQAVSGEGVWPLLVVAGASLGFALLAVVILRQRVLLGAVRYALVWIARLLLPAVIVMAAAMMSAFINHGMPPAGGGQYSFFVGLLIAHFIIFLLAYNTGEAKQPPFWLRLSASVAPLSLAWMLYPLAAPLALFGEAGDRQEFVLFFLWEILFAVLTAILALGVLSQLVPGQGRWMRWLAPMLTGYAMLLVMLPAILIAWGSF